MASHPPPPAAAVGAARSCSTPTSPPALPAVERKAFLEVMRSEQIRAEVAIHNGDMTPRLSTWSQRDPVTLFGAARVPAGRQRLEDRHRHGDHGWPAAT